MYSFEPDDEQKMLIEVSARFSTNELRPLARDADEGDDFSRSTIEKGWELGILQASVPEIYGGFGDRSALTSVLALEELACGDVSGAIAVLTPGLYALPLLLAGSEQQKQKYLPPVIEGEWRPFTSAFIEPTFDFDPEDLRTIAKLIGQEYVLDGEKVYVPFAQEAQSMIVYANLDGKTQGFIVPQDTAGLTIGERQKMLGLNALPSFSVSFDNVHIPEENRIGGRAGHEMSPILDAMRVGMATVGLGVSRAAFEYARDYAKEREAFGVKIAQKQSIAFMLAEMATEIEAIRLLTWEAAWMLDMGKGEAGKTAYLALTGAADMAMMVTDRAVQILGGHGYIREYPVEMWMRNGRAISMLTGLVMV